MNSASRAAAEDDRLVPGHEQARPEFRERGRGEQRDLALALELETNRTDRRVRVDLYRGSDKALMASTRVRKALNVPGDQKAVLMEAERFLRRVSRVQ